MDTFDYVQHFFHRLANAPGGNRLIQVELHPGQHCDLYRCPHCYGHGQRTLAGDTLSAAEIGAALDQVAASDPTVIVSGITTEPLTHPHAADVIAEVRGRNLPLGLYTKGRRLEGDVVDALLDGSAECFVTVSIDEVDPAAYLLRHGLTTSICERGPHGLSGEDYLQRVTANVRAFKARRDARAVPIEIRIALLLFAGNCDEACVADAVDSLAGLADRLRVAFPQDRNDGRPAGAVPADTAAALDRLRQRFASHPNVKILNSAVPTRDASFTRCRAQRFQVTIDRSGNVFPCPQVAVQPYQHLSFGNIRERPLAALLASPGRAAMFEMDVDSQMRCRICDRKDEAVNVALGELGGAFDRHAAPAIVGWRPRTVGEMLCRQAQAIPDRPFARFEPGSGDADLSYGDTCRLAFRWAHLFDAAGLTPSQAVLIALPNGPDFVGAFFGAMLVGLVPAPSMPRRLTDAQAYQDFLATRAASIDAAALVVDPADAIAGPAGLRVITRDALDANADHRAPTLRDGPALYQFTSGTSGGAKAVVLTDQALLFQTRAIARALRAVPDDVGVSWLPLFHDMGLFGFLLTPASTGASICLLRAETFARRPRIWFETISRLRGTVTSGPPSAYVLAARCARPGLDLRSLRAAIVGAERIMPAALRAVHTALSPFGLSWSALTPAYGMAEVGAAATMAAPSSGARWETIDASRMQTTGEARVVSGEGHEVVCCGAPLESTVIRIVDDRGRVLADRRVGHITLKSPSQTTGHVVDRTLQRDSLRDGWLLTGDQGYVADGELFVTGRMRDLLVVAGEKFVPEQFEQAAADVEGVRSGRVVAVGHVSRQTGAEQVALLVETMLHDEPARQQLTIDIRQSLSRRSLPVSDVILVPPKTIERTPNGKLPRARYQQRLLAGEFRA
jgi:fatty-acyl-CoA synthase